MNKKFNGTTVETNGVRSIAGGGTGSTTAAGALTALGAEPAFSILPSLKGGTSLNSLITTLLDTNSDVVADQAPPVRDANYRNGWYFTNNTVGRKFNWYFYSKNTKNLNLTLGNSNLYCVATIDQLANAFPQFPNQEIAEGPNIYIYTTPQVGDPDFYRSRVVYTLVEGSGQQVGVKYLMHTGADPGVLPELPRLQLVKSSVTSVGPQNPNEEILYYSVQSNSSAPINTIKLLIEANGFVAEKNGYFEYNFTPALLSHTHTLAQITQSSATNGQVATWNGTAWVPATPVVTNFQPSPEYAADSAANAQVSGFDGQPTAIFSLTGTDSYQGDGIEYSIHRSGQSYGGVAGSWMLEYQPTDAAGGMVAISTTATTYPWQAAWTNGVTVVKAALPRIVGTPLAVTASEGTSAYAARADHRHPFPTASQVGAAPAGNYVTLDGTGKVPSTQLPSYVDDVLEYATLSALQADTTARVSGKIYVVRDTGKIYRWSGSTYIEISNTLELGDLQMPDAFASVYANVPNFTTRELPLTGTFNGKPRYTGSFGGDNYDVYWTGTNWKAQAEYNDDGYSYGESIATGNTAYPWQATGWTNGGGVTRVGTYNAALAPAPLGAEAYSGVGTKAAREDHVHPLPTPAAIGAAASSHTHPLSQLEQSAATNGQVPVWSATTSAWVPQNQEISNLEGFKIGFAGDSIAVGYGTLDFTLSPFAWYSFYMNPNARKLDWNSKLAYINSSPFTTLDPNGGYVFARGTENSQNLPRQLALIQQRPPDVLVLQVGSNDLFATLATTNAVFDAVTAFLTGVKNAGVKHTLVFPVPPRQTNSTSTFTLLTNAYNNRIENYCKINYKDLTFINNYQGIVNPTDQFYRPVGTFDGSTNNSSTTDGLHFSAYGVHQFFNKLQDTLFKDAPTITPKGVNSGDTWDATNNIRGNLMGRNGLMFSEIGTTGISTGWALTTGTGFSVTPSRVVSELFPGYTVQKLVISGTPAANSTSVRLVYDSGVNANFFNRGLTNHDFELVFRIKGFNNLHLPFVQIRTVGGTTQLIDFQGQGTAGKRSNLSPISDGYFHLKSPFPLVSSTGNNQFQIYVNVNGIAGLAASGEIEIGFVGLWAVS